MPHNQRQSTADSEMEQEIDAWMWSAGVSGHAHGAGETGPFPRGDDATATRAFGKSPNTLHPAGRSLLFHSKATSAHVPIPNPRLRGMISEHTAGYR